MDDIRRVTIRDFKENVVYEIASEWLSRAKHFDEEWDDIPCCLIEVPLKHHVIVKLPISKIAFCLVL